MLDTWGAGLTRVSPELAGRLAVADVDVIDPERERAVVQAALHQFLSHAAREHRLLFVIEDLHWASSATTDAVAHIARVGGEAPLMLLITTRDDGTVADRVSGSSSDAWRAYPPWRSWRSRASTQSPPPA